MGNQDNIKIIVAGLPRTGTISIKWALESLGYGPCFHLMEIDNQLHMVKRSADLVKTADAKERRRKIRSLFAGYEVVLEQPGTVVLPDLLHMYPNAKVILSTRSSADAWLDSWHGLGLDSRTRRYRILGFWAPGALSSSDLLRAWSQKASERLETADEASPEFFHRYHDWVRSLVPEHRLLQYDVTQGWSPLTDFLGVFPRANQRKVIRSLKKANLLFGIAAWVLIFCCVFLALEVIAIYLGIIQVIG
ncbi:hypothetical protein F4778DRAFT_802274 [Xylariomycetidae sp. FL2044]|nr:hypothetical protein F4778DRAFT_802274 [Xylariomycetidae sp. FL2044]